MQYTKAMIDLVQEVRRRAPKDQKPSIKLANPDVLSEIANIYHKNTSDAVLRAVIKELLELAGPPWEALLHQASGESRDAGGGQADGGIKSVVRSYRGAVSLEEASSTSESESASERRKKRVYRGRVLED